jgi:hypothetical protein
MSRLLARGEIYKTPRPHEVTLCRPGDLAELTRSHCKQETGLLVQIVGEPHLCYCLCAYCQQPVTDWFVEIFTTHPDWQKIPGPWFAMVKWLKRIDPTDPVFYQRVRNYAPIEPTPEQIIQYNKP